MRNFRVQRVDGNVVALATDSEHFFQRINPFPEKREAIEKALRDVFKIPLKIQVVLVSDLNSDSTSRPAHVDLHDPTLSAGLELGAEIRRLDEQNT